MKMVDKEEVSVSKRDLDGRTSQKTADIFKPISRKGIFVVIDGADGIGKGEMETAMRRCEEKQGRAVFDTIGWSKAYGDSPELKDFFGIPVPHFNTIMTAEPRYVGIGADIRNEITFKNFRTYPTRVQIESYSIDRLIQMGRVVVPALENGLNVLQSRSVASTLTYQVLIGEDE